MTDSKMPERIWVWEIDNDDVPPNGYYSVADVDDSTKYIRADLANPAHVADAELEAHPDDLAVDRFAAAMKAKLKWERDERGRHGWSDPQICSTEYLSGLLIDHLAKGNAGNFEDIANFCMMLHQRGDHPEALATALRARTAQPVGGQWQHVKRGSIYREVGRGKVQTDTPLTDYAEVVIYQGVDDGMIWVRPVSEFEDGRFAALLPDGGAPCRKCGGEMKPGIAMGQTFAGGMPDFPGDDAAITLSAGGPGQVIGAMKCSACGWSVTDGGA